MVENRKGITGEHSIEISEEGLREKTTVNDSFSTWESVTKLDQDKKYLFIFLGHEVYTIPKSAFTSIEEADAFFNKCVDFKGKF